MFYTKFNIHFSFWKGYFKIEIFNSKMKEDALIFCGGLKEMPFFFCLLRVGQIKLSVSKS